jgi:DNA-directed RNA polymerase subunit RPC12/RpoP
MFVVYTMRFTLVYVCFTCNKNNELKSKVLQYDSLPSCPKIAQKMAVDRAFFYCGAPTKTTVRHFEHACCKYCVFGVVGE